ncbi:MAG: hypothetical protein AAF810_04255 [Cyanobacteria bacterium P01_D01_bin.36]
MKDSQNYVLIVEAPSNHVPDYLPTHLSKEPGEVKSPATNPPTTSPPNTQNLAKTLSCPVVTINSPLQALALAQADPPHLVILSGDDGHTWSAQIARKIKQNMQHEGIVIVAITASSDRSWQSTSDSAEIDGFFVEPVSADVLSSLNESAITKKHCFHTVC